MANKQKETIAKIKNHFFSHATCTNGNELPENAAKKLAAEGTVHWTSYLQSMKQGTWHFGIPNELPVID